MLSTQLFALWVMIMSCKITTAESLKSTSGTTFYKGHDLSTIKYEEDRGVVFKDTARLNTTRPVEHILGDGGMNSVKLR